jgi:serine/threonine-protein kinase
MADLINNRYRPLSLLGSGGSSKTYLAEDTHLPSNRRCVVKQLRPPTDDSSNYPILKERFQREAVILEMLGKSSEQIPKLQAYFTEGQEFYLVQDWIDGESIGQRVRSNGPFSESEVVSFLHQILPVLEYIHSKGIVHRDIKPENIMLRKPDDLPVLIDFGAVKEVVADQSTTIIIGSPGFMPIEQATGKPVFASDLYSLGFTAAFMLSGKRPRELNAGDNESFLSQEPFKTLDPVLLYVIGKSIRMLPSDRFQTANQMLAALKGDVEPTVLTEDTTLKPATTPPRLHERKRSSRRTVILLSLLFVTLIAAGALVTYRYTKQTPIQTATSTAPQPQASQTAEFEITRTNDAYTSVRAAPRSSSPEIVRLYPGTRIICQTSMVVGETLWSNNQWRYCPSVEGYVHSTLVRPI